LGNDVNPEIKAKTMSWVIKHKHILRAAILALVIISFMGPWAFDKTNVPAQYVCDPTSIRLEGDFCGHPIAGTQSFIWIITDLGSGIQRILRGELISDQTAFRFWIGIIYSLAVILLILPIINILAMLLREEGLRLQKLHFMVCELNLIAVLFVGISRFPKMYLALWGIWLYFGVMISTLVLEKFLLKSYSSKG
jgi:hypothetical protein